MTPGLCTQISSRSSPTGSARSSSVVGPVRTIVSRMGTPTLPTRRRPGGLDEITADVSVQPYPSRISAGRDPLFELAEEVECERRGAAADVAQGVEMRILEWLRQEHLHHRGDERGSLAAVLLAQRQELSGVVNQRWITASPGSSTCMPTMVTIIPYACDSGSGVSARVSPGTWSSPTRSGPVRQRLLWLSGTPLARPVVPPVYMSAARSASARDTSSRASQTSSTLRSTRRPSPASAKAASAALATMMCSTAGADTDASRTVGINSGVVTTATAEELTRMCASSDAVTRNTTGVTTAPARQIAL